MSLYARPKPPRLLALLIIFVYLVFSCFLLETTRFRAEKPRSAQMLEAAERTEACFLSLKEARIAAGYPIDRLDDPNETGMVGMEFTGITTSVGALEAKRSTTNPNCAAMITDFLVRCGVSEGDAVACNFSSSFPCLNIATLCALDVLGADGIIMNSIGASTYGANLPEFAYLDMEQVLLEKGLIRNHTRWFSLGGSRDAGIDMMEIDSAEAIAARAQARGLTRLQYESTEDNLSARESIFTAEADKTGRPLRAFVNIGGNLLAFGGGENLIDAPNGLVRAPFKNMEHTGLIPWALDHGIPVIHLLEMKSLLPANGLPFDPVPLPQAGEGDVYEELRYRKGLALCLASGAALLCVFLLRHR